MALQTTGPISLADIATEFGGTVPHSLGEYYRGGGLVPSGPSQNNNISTSGSISIGGFYGSVRQFMFTDTISTNRSNYNVLTAASAAGWDGVTPLNASITVNSGVYVSATSTGGFAFDTGSSVPSGSVLSLVNNGFIVGMGGAGGLGGTTWFSLSSTVGSPGGSALKASIPITITNNGTIAGGGGGGGGGGGVNYTYTGFKDQQQTAIPYGGGGGGGRSGTTNAAGGAGGRTRAVGSLASNNGGDGTTTSGGAGGAAVTDGPNSTYWSAGAAGGNWGTSGGTSLAAANGTVPSQQARAGGSAGAAVVGNSNITWTSTGTRLGAVT